MAGAKGNSTRNRRAVAETLPDSADKDTWLAELEQIARDELPSEKLVEFFVKLESTCNRLLQVAPLTNEDRATLRSCEQLGRAQAKHHGRLRREPRIRRRHYAILLLWWRHAGDPPAHDGPSPAMAYMQAATKFVFGKAKSASRAEKYFKAFRKMRVSAAEFGGAGAMSIDAKVIPASERKRA
jgi:hypothetical protein